MWMDTDSSPTKTKHFVIRPISNLIYKELLMLKNVILTAVQSDGEVVQIAHTHLRSPKTRTFEDRHGVILYVTSALSDPCLNRVREALAAVNGKVQFEDVIQRVVGDSGSDGPSDDDDD